MRPFWSDESTFAQMLDDVEVLHDEKLQIVKNYGRWQTRRAWRIE